MGPTCRISRLHVKHPWPSCAGRPRLQPFMKALRPRDNLAHRKGRGCMRGPFLPCASCRGTLHWQLQFGGARTIQLEVPVPSPWRKTTTNSDCASKFSLLTGLVEHHFPESIVPMKIIFCDQTAIGKLFGN